MGGSNSVYKELWNSTHRFTGGFGGTCGGEHLSLFCSNEQTFTKADCVPGFWVKHKCGMVPALLRHVAGDF